MGGALLSFCDWRTSRDWHGHIEDAGFAVKSQVIWNRLHHGMGDLRGAFAPMHDVIWYGAKGRRVFVNGRPKSVIECRRPSPSEDFGHPTCKPVSLMQQLLSSVHDGADTPTILDPFMGSGSTAVACVGLGWNFIGFELEMAYYNTAVSRVKAAQQDFCGGLL